MKDIVSFSEGLRLFFSKGALCNPVTVCENDLKSLEVFIQERIENISVTYGEDDNIDDYIKMLNWVKHKVSARRRIKNGFRIRLTKNIGARFLMMVHKYRWEIEYDKNLDASVQWLVNSISTKWSQSELCEPDK